MVVMVVVVELELELEEAVQAITSQARKLVEGYSWWQSDSSRSLSRRLHGCHRTARRGVIMTSS